MWPIWELPMNKYQVSFYPKNSIAESDALEIEVGASMAAQALKIARAEVKARGIWLTHFDAWVVELRQYG